MSKTDDMRAMREARYAGSEARATPSDAAVARRSAKPRAVKAEAEAVAAPDPAPRHDDLCGHRSISGRTCTREQGHSAKSHRYA